MAKDTYRSELDAFLRNDIPQISLFYGDSAFYTQYYTNIVLKALKSRGDCEINKFYFSDCDLENVLDILSSSSLFSGANIVVLKIDFKINKTNIENFKSIAKALTNSDNALIIEYYQDDKITSRDYLQYARKLKDIFLVSGVKFISARFFMPNPREALEFLTKKSASLKINISPSSLNYLYAFFNNDLILSLNELNKYALLEGKITNATIDEMSYSLSSYNVEDILNLIFSDGRFADMMVVVGKLIDNGINHRDITMSLQKYFYSLFLLQAGSKTAGGSVDFASILGYLPPADIQAKLKSRSVKIKFSNFATILNILNQLKFDIQATSKNDFDMLCSALIKIKDLV